MKINRNEGYKIRHNKNKRDKRRGLIRALKDQPCVDCGGVFHYCVMDFDHVKGDKSFDVSTVVQMRGINVIMNEIAKCDVVCANCHRLREWRRNYVR